jgi:AcrR family transcriptional regulator
MSPREQLLQKCLRYFLQHGVANLSLRPLAQAVGTSARMLVHHFGSKEGLITAVMDQVRARLQSLFEPLIADEGNHLERSQVMLSFWKLMTSGKNLPYMRLSFEVQILAIQNPRRYRRYLIETSSSWMGLVERALPPGKSSTAMATLSTAIIDGLMLDYLSTGDLRRTSRAVELFLEQMSSQPSPSKRRGARP